MDEIFSFGPYGAYIWAAYGLSALGLGALTVFSWRAHAKAKARIRALERNAAS